MQVKIGGGHTNLSMGGGQGPSLMVSKLTGQFGEAQSSKPLETWQTRHRFGAWLMFSGLPPSLTVLTWEAKVE